MSKKVFAIYDVAGKDVVFVFGVNSEVEACRVFDDFISRNEVLQRYPEDYDLMYLYDLPEDISGLCKRICNVSDRIKRFSRAQAQGESPESAQAEGEM